MSDEAKAEKRRVYQKEYRVKNRDRLLADKRSKYWADPQKYRDRVSNHANSDLIAHRASKMRLLGCKEFTAELFIQMFSDQGGKCAICRKEIEMPYPGSEVNSTAHIDHCHKTLKVRGLLCKLCNLGIGGLRDDPSIASAAIAYLTPEYGGLMAGCA